MITDEAYEEIQRMARWSFQKHLSLAGGQVVGKENDRKYHLVIATIEWLRREMEKNNFSIKENEK